MGGSRPTPPYHSSTATLPSPPQSSVEHNLSNKTRTSIATSIVAVLQIICTASLEVRGAREGLEPHPPCHSWTATPFRHPVGERSGGAGLLETRLLFWRAFPYPHPTCLCVVRSTAAPFFRIHRANSVNALLYGASTHVPKLRTTTAYRVPC